MIQSQGTKNIRYKPGFILLTLCCLLALLIHNFEHSLSNRSAVAIFSSAGLGAPQPNPACPEPQDRGLPGSSSSFPKDDCTTCRMLDYAGFALSSLSASALKTPLLWNRSERPPLAPVHISHQPGILPFSARAPPKVSEV